MHICPGNTKLEKKIANLTKLVARTTSTPNSKAKRTTTNPLPPSLNDLLKNFKPTDSSLLHNNNNKSSTQHTPQRVDTRTDTTQNITKKETKQEDKKAVVESYEEREEEEREDEEREETVEQMVEQPSGYFHDVKHSTYVLKSNEEDKELTVEPLLYKQLFDYQREGIKWMWNLYMSGKGGILGDDMGLGKTMQVVAFLSSMIRSGHISHALVVMPLSVLKHWEQELEKWGKGLRFRVYHGTSKKERADSIDRVISRGGILLTTYGLVLNQTKQLSSLTWDYVVLDEGHKIKDPLRKISQKAAELKSVNRILLTGTPIQNNMKEMWALFDWACNGKLLGNYKSFRIGYEGPIVKGLDRHASLEEKQIGESVSQELMRLVAPHFIRREKKILFGKKSPPKQPLSATKSPSVSPSISTTSASSSSSSSSPQRPTMCLTRKNDLVVWLTLSSPQKRLYEDFLGSEEVRNALNQTQSHLAALTRLKQICIHPCLLNPATSRQSYPLSFHSANSAKIAFLMGLIPELQAGGHRLLIFSQYTTILDVIQSCITEMGCSFLRLDGSISSTAERQRRIQLFNTKKEIFCFLLTTGAGALGINLTTADRVLIFDPSWNTNDNQAVDRAYRVGQTRDVVVYRLILCGTIEEKMYRKQVYKSALQDMLNACSQYRYFSKQDLSEMFVLDDTEYSATQQQLAQLHNDKIRSYPYLDSHLGFLHDTLGIVGVSHHDLLFSEKPEEVEPSEASKTMAARAQSTLFDEQPTPRRRKTTKTPKKKVVVVDDNDDGEESEFDYEPGVSSNPIHIEDDDETPYVDEQEDTQTSQHEEPADEEMQPEEKQDESDDEMRNVGKRFRRLRRIVDEEEEEETQQEETQHEENHHEEPQHDETQYEEETKCEDMHHEETINDKENESLSNDCEEEQIDEVSNVADDVEELLEPLSANACEMHSTAVAPFICYNCSCYLSEEQKLNYEEVLNKAKLYHRNGNLKDALRCYYTALLICDDNLQLHACIIDLQNC